MQAAEILVLLLASVTVFALLAQRLTIPYPILLVLGGLVISFVPGLPVVRLDPELVLLIFLPPLLFAQAWITPWREFKAYLRPILMLAVGCVLFTAAAVAFAVHWIIGLPLAVGFALGAIVSPPDAVAASAVAQQLKLPRRVVTILEGESLVNDATGLVAFRFAVAAVVTGAFSTGHAVGQFGLVVAGGIIIGVLVAYLASHFFRRVRENAIVITVSLLVPYVGYLAAERLHVSGVLAAVASGLYLGTRSSRFLSAATRLEASAVWDTLIFLLNSVIFVLIGLQLPSIWNRLAGYSVLQLTGYALAVCATVIVVRVLWVFPGAYLPRILSRRIREREPEPGWRNVMVVAWSGMRGVVSLAAALALPLTTASGAPFPGRDLLVFLTFAVILGTLVGQGLTLPALIRFLGVQGDRADEQHELRIRAEITDAAQKSIQEQAEQKTIPERALAAVAGFYERRAADLNDTSAQVLGWSSGREELIATRNLRRHALAAERRRLIELSDAGEVEDELRHQLQRELDIAESHLDSEKI